MASVAILDWDKKKVGEVELPSPIFGIDIRNDIMHEVVKWQLASRRQGTSMTKTKGLVSGGGKKPFKQKGTGNARQGSTRSPLMPGGGTMFGPTPRDYSYSLPKKVKMLGLKSALSHLVKEGKLFVVNEMDSEGKTAELYKRLQKFGLQKAVLIDSKENGSFKRASKNLAKYRYYAVPGLNVYDLLKYDAAVITKSAVDSIVERLGAKV